MLISLMFTMQYILILESCERRRRRKEEERRKTSDIQGNENFLSVGMTNLLTFTTIVTVAKRGVVVLLTTLEFRCFLDKERVVLIRVLSFFFF